MCIRDRFKAAADKFLETKDDTKANVEPTTALIAELEKAAAASTWSNPPKPISYAHPSPPKIHTDFFPR